MQLSYKIVGASGWAMLSDDTVGDAMPTFMPHFADNLMETPGFGAASVDITPMGNTEVTLQFTVSKVYLSASDAKTAIRGWRTKLKGLQLHLQVVEGSDKDFYPNGALKDMSANLQGKSVDYYFTFKTQDVTTTQPTT